MTRKSKGNSDLWINIISVVVPLVVAILISMPNRIELGAWTKSLPHFIGGINLLTSFVLITGYMMVKQNNITGHRVAMSFAFMLGGLFLVCYVTYHLSNPPNQFKGAGAAKFIYLLILGSHIILSVVVLPLVLRALSFAMKGDFGRHVKIVKWAFPIWLYVSVSGVIVYFMLYWLF